jgi:beta-galactosidase GanA
MPRLDTMHLNTVLAAVTWELMEPREGKYDFSLVDSILIDARANHLKVVLLWFGTWKNGLSHYVPGWVKTDFKRFPRMHIKGGYPVESITPLSTEALKADTKAFAALMKHVKEVDAQRTVIMMQVENLVGLIGDSRDRSPIADKAYGEQVPAALINSLVKNKAGLLPETQKLWGANGFRTKGTWAEVFGTTPQAEEAFMAWNYATFMNAVAAAGKAEYALPMYVNTWIVRPAGAIA